jgi:hypothetical protein
MSEEKKINETFVAEKWASDFEEFANRLLCKLDKIDKFVNETMQQLLAKMQAALEMGEIYQQASQRLPEGWTRGLSREQAREVLTQKYNEELLAKLQGHLNKSPEDWEKLRLPCTELIQWSKLPDAEKEKWLELYNKPMSCLNITEGDNYARQTPEHPQENQQSEKSAPQSRSSPEATGQI